MSDLGSTDYSETDASNNQNPPAGWPEGMNPSGVNNSARANMGAEKRFWNRINAVKTTAGTTSAYTLTYDVAAAAYYDGEIHSFVVDATNAAAATLNINGLGARQLRLFGGNLLAGALLTDDIVQVRYNLADTAFDIIPQGVWTRIGTQDPSATANVDFTSIPAGVSHLMLVAELTVGTDAANIQLQTYGADDVLDTGASDYAYQLFLFNSAGSSLPSGDSAHSAIVLAGTGIDNSTAGALIEIKAGNIQAATNTKFNTTATYLDQSATTYVTTSGGGMRIEADRITGLRLSSTSGTVTGKATLYAAA